MSDCFEFVYAEKHGKRHRFRQDHQRIAERIELHREHEKDRNDRKAECGLRSTGWWKHS
jgi:hypothetical protein